MLVAVVSVIAAFLTGRIGSAVARWLAAALVPPRSLILRLLDAGLARRRQIGVFSVGVAWSWRPLCGWLSAVVSFLVARHARRHG